MPLLLAACSSRVVSSSKGGVLVCGARARRPVMSASASTRSAPAFVGPAVERVATVAKQTFRCLEFWRRALTIWTSFKLTQLSIFVLAPFRPPEWPRRAWARQHRRAGDGFYVKAGQLIALQAFVPPVIRDKLRTLHDDMPRMPAAVAHAVLQSELRALGHDASIFEPIDYDSSVLGSASIAQVHRARLRDGGIDVALKLQHPRMEQLMMSDLANFRALGEILQRTELKFDLIRPVRELRRQLALEFDFLHEAKAMLRIRHSLASVRGVTIPIPINGLASRALLVMSFVDGAPLTRLARLTRNRSKRAVRLLGRKIMRRLAQSYAKMVLVDGYFHADCHPGNIVITNSNVDIGLLDFGQTKRLTETQRIWFARLVYAMAQRDAPAIAAGMRGLGIEVKHNRPRGSGGTASASAKSLQSTLTLEEKLAYTMFDTASVKGVSDNPFSSESALRSGSVSNLPQDLMFLLRTIQILKGLCKATYNDNFSLVAMWKNTARDQIHMVDRNR